MQTDLDAALRRLSTAADHPGLLTIEDAVLARINAGGQDDTRSGFRLAAIAAVGAIALGAVSAGPIPAPASAAATSPFGPSSPLAPSTLLLADG
jgi:hypothetical protein